MVCFPSDGRKLHPVDGTLYADAQIELDEFAANQTLLAVPRLLLNDPAQRTASKKRPCCEPRGSHLKGLRFRTSFLAQP